MGFAFYYTLAVLVVMTAILVREVVEPDITILAALLLLTIPGVISVREAFAGFSNHGMLTVAFLFIVAGGLQQTGILNRFGHHLLGSRGSVPAKLLRLMLPVSAVSAFFNNTPVVAMIIPVIRVWAKKYGYTISRFLIPLSYAAILGGTCTLIGTSTNLVVHGLMIEHGFTGLGFFEIAKIGLPVAIAGILGISLIGYRLLPERSTPMVQLGGATREFVIAVKVEAAYPGVGRTIEAAGLRHLKGLFLFQIERDGHMQAPVGPDEIIHTNDRLFFTGLPETILELQRTPGLALMKDAAFDLKNYDSDDIGSFEVVISPNSPLIGRNVRRSKFRSRYDAVIVAIHRSGEQVKKKIGDIYLKSGDTLLLLAKNDFLERWYHSSDFFLVSRSTEIPSKPHWKSWLSLAVLVLMITVMALNLLPILVAVALAAVILLVSGCISPGEARNRVDWKVLLVIASAFGIAAAMDNSGVARFLAEKLVQVMRPLGTVGILAGVYAATSFYTEIITNNAAAALLFPVALSAARQAGADPRPFFLAIAIAASASFATPIGYQTNLMVYGPGGYRFRDFLKIGVPMNIFVGIVAVTLLSVLFF
ncbi:SLC13 family permease [bacterium]|nr:SLC13 family permease [bacterium]